MIDKLQNAATVKPNTTFLFIKNPIHQYYPVFTYALSSQTNTLISNKSKQSTIQSMHIHSEDSSIRFGKLTKTLLNPLIFIDGKNPSINQ